jgi:hypothetical protein
MQPIQVVLRVWKRHLQRDRALLLVPRGCLSSERALLNVGLDAPGAGGLGASQHGFCVARIGVGGKQVDGWSGFSCLGRHGPLASLVSDLLTFWPDGSSGLLTCGYCLVIGTGSSVAPPVRMLSWAPAGQLESKMC